MKTLTSLLVSLLFAGNCFAQAAGGAAQGGALPAASSGGAMSAIAAVVAVGVAGVAAVASYNSTTTANHH